MADPDVLSPVEMKILAEHWAVQAEKLQQLADNAAQQSLHWRKRAEEAAAEGTEE